MRCLGAPPITPSVAGACSANEAEAKASQHARKCLGIVMPRDHRAARNHRWVDAREQEELTVPECDNGWVKCLRSR